MKKNQGLTIPVKQVQQGVSYLTFPGLTKTGVVEHLFSTRLGGVSKGHLSSMNLSFARGDRKEYVRENYRRIAQILHCDMGDFVFSHQTHTANVRIVTEEDRGKGILREVDYQDVDGLVTKVNRLVLTTFFADCVPVFLVDPVNRVIGLCHCGWRGTAGRISVKTIERMESLGAHRDQILAAIGPSICKNCYEISADVAEIFSREFPAFGEKILVKKQKEKYQLDLWKTNKEILLEAGIKEEKIEVTNLCTCCNPEYLFSHRASQGMRGNMAAFLMLK